MQYIATVTKSAVHLTLCPQSTRRRYALMTFSSKPPDSVWYPTLLSWGWQSLDELNQQLEPLNFYLDFSEPAILCRTCKYALKPSENSNTVTMHLSKHDISFKQRKKLADFIHTLRLPDPKTLPARQDKAPTHPFLSDREGSTYSRCDYRTTSRDLFDRHVRKEHEGRGRKARDAMTEVMAFFSKPGLRMALLASGRCNLFREI
jgi:hypothetical protein